MLERTLNKYLNARLQKNPGGSSSYFDFVEKKTEEEFAVTANKAMDLAESGKDSFVVQVMDEETARELRLKYFQQDD